MKRLFTLAALMAALFVAALPASVATAQDRGRAYLNDFQSLLAKRADLRVAVQRQGLNAAFSTWLRATHPAALSAPDGVMTATAFRHPAHCCNAAAMCARCPACCAKVCCPAACCNANCAHGV